MKLVQVNFWSRPLPSRRLWLMNLLVGCLAAVAWALAWSQHTAWHSAQAALQGADQARQVAERGAAEDPALRPYEQSARAMLSERNLAWPSALRALESSAIDGAVLKSFEANAADGTIRAEVVLSSHGQVSPYLAALSAGSEHGEGPLTWAVTQAHLEPNGGAVTAVFAARASPASSNVLQRP